MPIRAEAFGQVTPGQVGPSLVKSMDEQQYAQNLQAGGDQQPIGLDAQKGKYTNLSASTERTKTAGKSPSKPTGRLDLQAAGADAVDGSQGAGLHAGAPGEARMFPGSQLSIMQSQTPAGLARAVQPGGMMTAERRP